MEVEAASEEDAVSVDAEEPQAARLRTMEAASTELTSFFIIVFPPRIKQRHIMGVCTTPCRFID